MGCAFHASQSGRKAVDDSTIGECAAVYGPGLEATYLGASAVDYLPYEETCEVNPHAVLECTDGGPEGKCKDSGIDYNAARAAVVAMGVTCPSELCDSCIVDYCAFGGDTSMIEGCIDDDVCGATLPKGLPSPPPPPLQPPPSHPPHSPPLAPPPPDTPQPAEPPLAPPPPFVHQLAGQQQCIVDAQGATQCIGITADRSLNDPEVTRWLKRQGIVL